jgi:hypothetical protein
MLDQRLEQIGRRDRKVEERADSLAEAKQMMFLGRGAGDLGDNIGPAIRFGGRIDDLGAGSTKMFIAKSGPGPGPTFYMYGVPGLDKSLGPGRS